MLTFITVLRSIGLTKIVFNNASRVLFFPFSPSLIWDQNLSRILVIGQHLEHNLRFLYSLPLGRVCHFAGRSYFMPNTGPLIWTTLTASIKPPTSTWNLPNWSSLAPKHTRPEISFRQGSFFMNMKKVQELTLNDCKKLGRERLPDDWCLKCK